TQLGVLRAFTANSACSALRFPNEPFPAGCSAHPEILNSRSVGGPFFVIIAKPSRPWTSSVRPKSADHQWGKDPLKSLLVGLDSWRAPEWGNWLGRSLAIKPTYGG